MNAELSGESYERTPCRGTHSPWIEGLKANSDAVIHELGHLTDFEFGCNRESVVWLEGYIERMKEAKIFNGPGRDKLISVFGSFLGECLVQCYGGTWKKRDGAWGIVFDDENIALPFTAVADQVDHGRASGIHRFFDLVPITFVGCIEPTAQPAEVRSADSPVRE